MDLIFVLSAFPELPKFPIVIHVFFSSHCTFALSLSHLIKTYHDHVLLEILYFFSFLVFFPSVIESPQINAMSLPHGQLYLTDGDSSLSDDEISLLIGHEMSHVINLHSLELIYVYAISNLFASPMILLLWGSSESRYLSAAIHFMITSMVNGFNNFESRHIELEADLQGMILAASACYNMSICPGFW